MYKYPKLVITCSLLLALHTAFEFELQTVQAVWSGPKFVQSGGLRSLDRTTAIAMTQRAGEKKVFTISQLEQPKQLRKLKRKAARGSLLETLLLYTTHRSGCSGLILKISTLGLPPLRVSFSSPYLYSSSRRIG